MDNKYFNKLKKYILENDLKNVFFYNTKDVDLCELISNSEFIINTSKSEILPLTLIEANSLKKLIYRIMLEVYIKLMEE